MRKKDKRREVDTYKKGSTYKKDDNKKRGRDYRVRGVD